jgi:hypothetical protein
MWPFSFLYRPQSVGRFGFLSGGIRIDHFCFLGYLKVIIVIRCYCQKLYYFVLYLSLCYYLPTHTMLCRHYVHQIIILLSIRISQFCRMLVHICYLVNDFRGCVVISTVFMVNCFICQSVYFFVGLWKWIYYDKEYFECVLIIHSSRFAFAVNQIYSITNNKMSKSEYLYYY